MNQWEQTLVIWLSMQTFVNTIQNSRLLMSAKSQTEFTIGPQLASYSTSEEPFLAPQHASCSLYKVVMTQDSFHQYVQYKKHIPEMKEFTLCAWHKLYNHSIDHPIFSYSLPHNPRAILSWIMNTPKKTYYMLAVNGHNLYQVNFPIKTRKWHHMCQSWNGKTGEWQLWVNGMRVGRGYYNLMTGKLIKGGGVAISGQDQADSPDGIHWHHRGTGLQGEVTLVQLYKAALSKGKAYSDHRHHHVYEWGHDGEPMDDTQPSTRVPYSISREPPFATQPTTIEDPFMEDGPHLKRLPSSTYKPMHNLELLTAFERLNPSNIFSVAEDRVTTRNISDHKFYIFQSRVDDKTNSLQEMKRMETEKIKSTTNRRHRRFSPIYTREQPSASAHAVKNSITGPLIGDHDKHQQKSIQEDRRRRVIIEEEEEEDLTSSTDSQPQAALYSEVKGHDIQIDDHKSFFKTAIQDSGKSKIEYEPAEWEVNKIAQICNTCDEDPFGKANLLSWQETPKKLFAGAEYIPAIPKCHIF